MAKKEPVARGLGWTDKQWKAFEKSGYDESKLPKQEQQKEQKR